jgi:hypothetical protein
MVARHELDCSTHVFRKGVTSMSYRSRASGRTALLATGLTLQEFPVPQLYQWAVDNGDSGLAADPAAALNVVTRTLLANREGSGWALPVVLTDAADMKAATSEEVDGPFYRVDERKWTAHYRAGSIYWVPDQHLAAAAESLAR